MSKVIDVRLDFPPSAREIAETLKFFITNKEGKGIANYRRIFGQRWAASLGMRFEDLEKQSEGLSQKDFDSLLNRLAKKTAVTPDQFLRQLDEAGVEWGLIDNLVTEKTAELISKYPDRLKGMVIFDPFKGAEGVKEIDYAIRNLGFVAVYVSSFHWGINATDPRFYPCFAKAVELDIPVFIYTAMNYRTDLPMDIARPLHIDRVAMDFPRLRIVATCGGWPWVPELIGLARRHPNIYIDTSSHRPKYLGVPGSGFEMLMQFGNTVLQDRIVFGSGGGDLALSVGTLVNEVRGLPLKEEVKEKWLYGNAVKLFKMDS